MVMSMLINNSYSPSNLSIKKIYSENNIEQVNYKGLKADVFEKSTPSFKGSSLDDFWGMLFDKVLTVVQTTSGSLLDNIKAIIKQTQREIEVSNYIDALSDKSIRKVMFASKNEKLSYINPRILEGFGYDVDFITQLFEQSNIKTVLGLDNFLRVYNRDSETKKTFDGQEIEAVRIYGLLGEKDNLSRFSELLLYLFNQEEDKDEPDYTKLNQTIEFLRKIGVCKSKDFDEKFACLKSRFNDFETISDKADAIDYLQRTYDDKISFLAEIIKQSDLPQSIDPKKVYASINDVIEYFYEKNNGESLSGLEEIIDYVVSEGKLKAQSLKQISSGYNDFQNPEDKINFFNFLKDCNVSISEFNALSAKSVVSDSDIKSIISNKEILSQYIAQIKGTKEADGFEFYKNFKDIIDTLYDEAGNPEAVKCFIEFSDRFNLKNSDSLLQFYNRASETKKRNITSMELKEFVDLFRYSDSEDLFAAAKAQNISVVNLLEQEKQKFLSVKDKIDSFIYSDSTAFFAGQSDIEIYKKYRDLLLENPDNVNSVLQNIVEFDIQNVNQYEQKALQVKPFTRFFKDKESMLRFFTENNIRFDSSLRDSLYRENCLEIFNALYDGEDSEKSLDQINYIATSGFLIKSKNRLSEFLEKMPSSAVRKEVLSIIADKKVPSVNSLEKFFKQYKSPNTKGVELLEFLKSLPSGIDFSRGIGILDSIQEKINALNVPLQINSNNINSINSGDIISAKSISTDTLLNILDGISDSSDDLNFIVSLPKATQKKEKNDFSSYRIAQEIASKIDNSYESYQNISRLLGIDRVSLSLPKDCSYYFYVRAIEKALPEKFVDFVNSDEWMKFSDDKVGSANLVLHARLRAIDRFALNKAENIDVLYKPETVTKLKALFKTIYTTSPIDIKGTESSKRFVADFVYGSNVVEAVFLDNGEMITIIPKKNVNKS